MIEPDSTRRDFLTGRAIRSQVERAGDALVDALTDGNETAVPTAGATIRLSTRAMACDFAVIMNPGPTGQVMTASDALDLVHELEAEMSVYRDDTELSRLNRRAAIEPVPVESGLYALLKQSEAIARATDGAFDPTSGPLIALWRQCRLEGRIPTDDEIARCRERTGIEHIEFDDDACAVRFGREGVELNLGGIGKGYALDRVGEFLVRQGIEAWCVHGGRSSVLAHGDHNAQNGWPIGIGNPLFTSKRFGTLLLQDRGMSTSGSNIQYYRHAGRRYGHILDPRTGLPVEDLLSVTVLAPTSAEADALSTAFFVLGVEKTRAYCDNQKEVSALLIPQPSHGGRLEPVGCGLADEILFLESEVSRRV